jgi:hypothetical protein
MFLTRDTRSSYHRGVLVECIRTEYPNQDQDDDRPEINWWVYVYLNKGNSPFRRDTPLTEVRAALKRAEGCRDFEHVRRGIEQSHDDPSAPWQQDCWWIRAGCDFQHSWDVGARYTWECIAAEGRLMVDALIAAGIVMEVII